MPEVAQGTMDPMMLNGCSEVVVLARPIHPTVCAVSQVTRFIMQYCNFCCTWDSFGPSFLTGSQQYHVNLLDSQSSIAAFRQRVGSGWLAILLR